MIEDVNECFMFVNVDDDFLIVIESFCNVFLFFFLIAYTFINYLCSMFKLNCKS